MHGRATWFLLRLPAVGRLSLSAVYRKDEYLLGDLPLRALTILVRVQRFLSRGRLICLGSVALHRDVFSQAFCSKLQLFFYGTLTPLELSLGLWHFLTVANSSFSYFCRDVLSHYSDCLRFIRAPRAAPVALLCSTLPVCVSHPQEGSL